MLSFSLPSPSYGKPTSSVPKRLLILPHWIRTRVHHTLLHIHGLNLGLMFVQQLSSLFDGNSASRQFGFGLYMPVALAVEPSALTIVGVLMTATC